MRILLIQSYLGDNESPIYPIGLAYLKSALSDEHDVRIYDTNTSKEPFEGLKNNIIDFSPDIIGISLRNIDSTNKRRVAFYYPFLKDAINAIKECTNAKIIIGGSGFSIYPYVIMEDEPRIDYGVLLEGEVTFSQLLQNLDHPECVRSILYRKNGRVVYTGDGGEIDLDKTKSPAWLPGLLDDYRDIKEAVGIETKRGCNLDCIYCVYSYLNGKKIRLRNPNKIVDEIEELATKHKMGSFTFIDSVFNIPQKHAEEICKEIIRRGIQLPWSAWFNERGFTRAFIELIKEAGCRSVILSPDGFSDTALKKLGKNISQKDILRGYRILKDIEGIEISYNFFKNPPGQSYTAFLKLVWFYLKAKRELGKRVHFEFSSIRIEPHSKLYQLALKEKLVHKDESLLYPVYYTNKRTIIVDKFFNLMLMLKGM